MDNVISSAPEILQEGKKCYQDLYNDNNQNNEPINEIINDFSMENNLPAINETSKVKCESPMTEAELLKVSKHKKWKITCHQRSHIRILQVFFLEQ